MVILSDVLRSLGENGSEDGLSRRFRRRPFYCPLAGGPGADHRLCGHGRTSIIRQDKEKILSSPALLCGMVITTSATLNSKPSFVPGFFIPLRWPQPDEGLCLQG